MKSVYSPRHHGHSGNVELVAGAIVPAFEMPSRAEFVLSRLKEVQLGPILEPDDHSLATAAKVHDKAYLDFLPTVYDRWKAEGRAGTALPFTWPTRGLRGDKLPEHIDGILVLGGSLGAEPLNKLMPAALAKLPAELRPQVFHQAGKQHAEVTAERYRNVAVEAEVAPFIKDMARAYGWADLVICRAGALTVSELAAAGLPSFLVPLPHAIDDHQSRNAEYLAKEGAAVLLPQHATDAAKLAAQLTEVLMHLEKLTAMGATARRLAKPDATRAVVDICQEVAHG